MGAVCGHIITSQNLIKGIQYLKTAHGATNLGKKQIVLLVECFENLVMNYSKRTTVLNTKQQSLKCSDVRRWVASLDPEVETSFAVDVFLLMAKTTTANVDAEQFVRMLDWFCVFDEKAFCRSIYNTILDDQGAQQAYLSLMPYMHANREAATNPDHLDFPLFSEVDRVTRHVPVESRYIMQNQPLYALNIHEFVEIARLEPKVILPFQRLRKVLANATLGRMAWLMVSPMKPIPDPGLHDVLKPPEVAKRAMLIAESQLKAKRQHAKGGDRVGWASAGQASTGAAAPSASPTKASTQKLSAYVGKGAARRRRSVMTAAAAPASRRHSCEVSRMPAAGVWGMDLSGPLPVERRGSVAARQAAEEAPVKPPSPTLPLTKELDRATRKGRRRSTLASRRKSSVQPAAQHRRASLEDMQLGVRRKAPVAVQRRGMGAKLALQEDDAFVDSMMAYWPTDLGSTEVP